MLTGLYSSSRNGANLSHLNGSELLYQAQTMNKSVSGRNQPYFYESYATAELQFNELYIMCNLLFSNAFGTCFVYFLGILQPL